MVIEQQPFGHIRDGTPVDLYTLTNPPGLTCRISNYGCTLVSLTAPDRNDKLGDVLLGFDSLVAYIEQDQYMGCVIGRCANRITQGLFHMDDVAYTLAQNAGEHHLHGGVRGFDKVVWQAEAVEGDDGVGLKLTYLSPDGEEGYPGNLSVQVTYTLTHLNALKIAYSATTDRKTIINLTNHAYFNLAGGLSRDMLEHELIIHGARFTPVDDSLIPTGELRNVMGSPLDFQQPRIIGARINEDEEQLRFCRGYDHNWVLNHRRGHLGLAASVYEPRSGRAMEVYTTEAGLQFYTGNFLDDHVVGRRGQVYRKHYGFCLEAQAFPDAPNKPNFPSTVLRPGETYTQTTIYRFFAR